MTPFSHHLPMMTVQLIEYSTVAMMVIDDKQTVQHMNPAAEVLIKLSARSAYGMSLQDLFAQNTDLLATVAQAQAAREVCNAWDYDLSLVDGRTEKVDYAVVPMVAEEERDTYTLLQFHLHPHMVNSGIGDNLEQQHDISRQLVRGLAHEIKNPLGGIRGAAQLLERELPSESLKEYTEVIIGEADRLRALVDRMLGPVKQVEKTEQSIHIALERVRQVAQADISNSAMGIHLERDYDPSIPDLPYDVELLIQAMLNVVRNAMQAINEAGIAEGVITLRTRAERQRIIHNEYHRLCVRIDIIDNGPGIPDDIIQHIFYPMVTNKASGTGLGLSIAQSLIVQHNGNIECSSKPGCTQFTILLPME